MGTLSLAFQTRLPPPLTTRTTFPVPYRISQIQVPARHSRRTTQKFNFSQSPNNHSQPSQCPAPTTPCPSLPLPRTKRHHLLLSLHARPHQAPDGGSGRLLPRAHLGIVSKRSRPPEHRQRS